MSQEIATAESARPVVKLEEVVKHFPLRRSGLSREHRVVHAVDGVSLHMNTGETLGIVGESGCGKSTLGRLTAGLLKPTSGTVQLCDESGEPKQRKASAAPVQMVFQDPATSLDPRLTIGKSVAEPLTGVARQGKRERVRELLDLVGLAPEYADVFPHELSGGQQQRACIARALIAEPRLIVHDESLSSLDVSLQAQIINLLLDLQQSYGVSYCFISHDLRAVRAVSTQVAVMYLGQVVELAPVDNFRNELLHPYAVLLRAAEPIADMAAGRRSTERVVLGGEPSSAVDPPPACRFAPRCPIARDVCRSEAPPLMELRPGHWAACHFAGEFET